MALPRTWETRERSDGDVVVRPQYDHQRHYLYGDCACEPERVPIIEDMCVIGYMILHNAFDGRE